jgi:hypothetical protein
VRVIVRGRIASVLVLVACGEPAAPAPTTASPTKVEVAAPPAPVDPLEAVKGCWAIDFPRMLELDEIPVGLAPAGFDAWMGGYRFDIGVDRLRQVWSGRDSSFDESLPITLTRRGDAVVVKMTVARPPSEPPGIPRPRFDEVTIAVRGADAIEIDQNYVVKSTWGVDVGPLPLRRVGCADE